MKSEKLNYVYKKMYDKIEMSKGMDEILKKKIMSEQAGKKNCKKNILQSRYRHSCSGSNNCMFN